MNLPVVTVFGGTGFLGRRVVRHLLDHAFAVRVASRHPDRAAKMFGHDARLTPVEADIRDPASVSAALAEAYGAVNAVSLYVERGADTFQRIHVDAAGRLAELARAAGLQRLAQVSGIGSDPASPSLYVRKRGEGELAVRSAFPDALLIRPAVMFGPDDAFLSVMLKLVRRLPVYPLFGDGGTRLQPAHVEDVAEAIARSVQRAELRALAFELGGPNVYRYRDLVARIAAQAARRPLLVPLPFAAWRALALIGERLPRPPITTGQVDLMQVDNVASAGAPSFADLGVAPQPLEAVLQRMVADPAG